MSSAASIIPTTTPSKFCFSHCLSLLTSVFTSRVLHFECSWINHIRKHASVFTVRYDCNSGYYIHTWNKCHKSLYSYLYFCFYTLILSRTHQKKIDFQIGDKICCTRNGYVTDKDKEDEAKRKKDDKDRSKSKKERLCNGEIFFIVQVW